ncbi:MAG TPA: helical backbone metal receptor [Saprospiraceae bacterium]|nr:helical backbone metal receptor [Saprospiraceae bacterium]
MVPSITETLCYIGLSDQIIGVTKFCIHPSDIKKKSHVIGGTKNPNLTKILSLHPDLIIANKEENRQEDIDFLRQHCPVYTSDIKTSIDHLRFVSDIQTIFPNTNAEKLLNKLTAILPYQENRLIRSCYLIWKDPWMSIGNDTFIHHMMEKYGFQNVCGHLQRYPILSKIDITAESPEVIFLSSEPFPFKEKHIVDLQKEFPNIHIRLVDGELFSWYGPKMLEAHDYLIKLHASILER